MLSNNVIKKLKIDLQRCLCPTEFHSFSLWKTKCLYNELCTIPRWSHILWFLSKHIKTISHMDHTITLFISIVYQCSYHPISNIRYTKKLFRFKIVCEWIQQRFKWTVCQTLYKSGKAMQWSSKEKVWKSVKTGKSSPFFVMIYFSKMSPLVR